MFEVGSRVQVMGGLLDGIQGTLTDGAEGAWLVELDDHTQVVVKSVGEIRETAQTDTLPRELGS